MDFNSSEHPSGRYESNVSLVCHPPKLTLVMLSESRGLTHEGLTELHLQHLWHSDAGFQGRNGERLHNLLRGLGLDNGHLAEDLPLAGLGGGLHAGLDAAQAGEGEDACLLHLGSADLSELVEDLGGHPM